MGYRTKYLLGLVLLLVAAALSGLGPSDRDLVARFDRAEADGRDEVALAAAEAVLERYPESAFWAFNAGRVLARLGRLDEAIGELRRSAEFGFSGIASFERHGDLDPLRDRADFEAVVDRVRANAEARVAAFRAEAREHEPATHVPAGLVDPEPPLVIALHGTGGDGAGMLERLRGVCDELGLVCVAPDALRPAGDGYSWTYRDEAEWFVEHLIGRAVEEHGIDRGRVVLLGFSQGANIALTMAQTRAEMFCAVVPVCGHFEPAITAFEGAPSRAYLLTGSRDPWKATYRVARDEFEERGGEAELRVVSGLGHEMPSRRELERALRWALSED